MTQPTTHLRPVTLATGFLLVCGLTGWSERARAQTTLEPVVPRPLATFDEESDRSLTIAPLLPQTGTCGAATQDTGASAPLRCPTAAHSLGFTLKQSLDIPGGQLRFRATVARGEDALISLDRQMVRRSFGRVRENMMAKLRAEVDLLEGNLKLSSKGAWSQDWERSLNPLPFMDPRHDERTGFSHDHSVRLKLLNSPGLRWQIDGRFARSSRNYRPAYAYAYEALSLTPGDVDSLRTKLNFGQVEAKGSISAKRNFLSASQRRSLSLGYGGVRLELAGRDGQRSSFAFLGLGESTNRARELSLDINLYSLAPRIALSDSGWSAWLPRQVRLTTGSRRSARPGSLAPERLRSTHTLFAMWGTPLGDTVVDYQFGRTRSQGGPIDRRRSQLLVNHNVRIDDWAVGLSMLSLKGDAVLNGEDDMSFLSASIARGFSSGANLSLSIGRDAQQLGGALSDFTLLSRSHQLRANLDLSAPLQEKLGNPSLYLTLEGQLRFDKSETSLRFFDEPVDVSQVDLSREGALVSFGYRF